MDGDSEITYRLRCRLRELHKQLDAIVNKITGVQEALDIAEKADRSPAPGFRKSDTLAKGVVYEWPDATEADGGIPLEK